MMKYLTMIRKKRLGIYLGEYFYDIAIISFNTVLHGVSNIKITHKVIIGSQISHTCISRSLLRSRSSMDWRSWIVAFSRAASSCWLPRSSSKVSRSWAVNWRSRCSALKKNMTNQYHVSYVLGIRHGKEHIKVSEFTMWQSYRFKSKVIILCSICITLEVLLRELWTI